MRSKNRILMSSPKSRRRRPRSRSLVNSQKQIQSSTVTSFMQRTKWTILMLVAFIVVFNLGHSFNIILILMIKIGVIKQFTSLKRNYQQEIKLPLTNFINWYFFIITQFYLLFRFISYKFPYLHLSDWFSLLAKHANLIFFGLWVVGFLSFVLSLQRGCYRYQFRLFGWINLAAALILLPISMQYYNIYQGICWFITPALLIIANDIFAYLVGYFLGKRKLIELSPKKTWEGFLGGAFFTFFFSFLISYFVQKSKYMICPQYQLMFTPFYFKDCQIPAQFIPQVRNWLGLAIQVSDFQLHCTIFALFASLIGPFGGFFASGFKRSLRIKDFGNLIPGHGGLTDRFDCQVMMGIFTYLYSHSFVGQGVDKMKVLLSYLSEQNKQDLFKLLSK